MKGKVSSTSLLIAGVLAGGVSASFSAAAEVDYQDYGFVGGGVSFGKSVFSDESSAKASVEPNFFYNGKYGFVDGALVNVSLTPWVGISGQWRFAEVSDDVTSLPSGVEDRDGNGELGITFGTVGARLTYLQDVTDEHKGYEVQLHLARSFETPIDSFALTPYIEVDYRDKKLSQHLYNVSAKEAAASSLKAYSADSSLLYQAGLIGIYDFTDKWIGLVKLELQHHDSNSPLVQHDLGWAVSVGVAYNFSDWL